jgi:hypothetical protein
MEKLVVVARLRPGTGEQAARLIASGPPFDPGELGFSRHTVFLSAREAVFVFEAPEVEWIVDDLINDPVISAAFGAWQPLLEGPPRLAREQYRWVRETVS